MKTFLAKVTVTLLPQVLDTQGQSVEQTIKKINIDGIQNVRIGKYIQFQVVAADATQASKKVEELCKKILHNAVIESYAFSLEE